jgi:hypothetical protein
MKAILLTLAAVLLFGCYSPEEEAMTEEKFSSKEQAIVVCSSECAPPTYDGNPVACASNLYCFSDAAGAYCLNGNNTWSSYFCQAAPPSTYCGDGICNGGETWQTCSDCPPPGAYCGDGICNGGETWQTCSDCTPPFYCGDGVCNRPDEDRYNCSDCPGFCPTCPIP